MFVLCYNLVFFNVFSDRFEHIQKKLSFLSIYMSTRVPAEARTLVRGDSGMLSLGLKEQPYKDARL